MQKFAPKKQVARSRFFGQTSVLSSDIRVKLKNKLKNEVRGQPASR